MSAHPHLAIIVDLDKLPEVYNEPYQLKGKTVFVLTLSSGLVRNQPPDKAVLSPQTRWRDLERCFLPWNWYPGLPAGDRRSIPKVRIWHRKGAGDFTLLKNENDPTDHAWPVWDLYEKPQDPLIVEKTLAADSDLTRQHYSRTWKPILRKDDRVDWDAKEEPAIAWSPPGAAEDETGEDENQFHLPPQIARVATSCFPQNHASGLACCVTVDHEFADGDEVIAFPVWPESWGRPEDPGQHDDLTADVPMRPYPKFANGWSPLVDPAGAALPVIGYSRTWKSVAHAAAASVISLSKMEITLKPSWSSDWLVALEGKTAALFDVAQRLVDAARAQLEAQRKDPSTKLPSAGVLGLWVVRAGRELADFGFKLGPDGERTTLDLERLDPRQKKAIEDQDKLFQDPKVWLDWLVKLPPSGDGRSFADFQLLDDGGPLTNARLAMLERFVSDLRDAATTRHVILAQWQKAFAAKARTSDEEQQDQDTLLDVETRLGEFGNPAMRVARGILAGPDPKKPDASRWAMILNSPPGSIAVTIRDEILAYMDSLGGGLGNISTLQNALKKLLLAEAGTIAPEADEDRKKNLNPREAPHGITLQVDQPGHADATDQENDLLSRMAGVIVLARRDHDTEWRCLNHAKLELVEDDKKAASPEGLYLAPNRLGYSAGRREATITYDNHPLAAESPAAALFVRSAPTIPGDKDSKGGRIRHLPVPHGDGDFLEARIPGLAYGIDLRVLALPVLNAGIHHPGMTAGHPALPRRVTTATALPAHPSLEQYRRLVGVSEVRTLSKPYPADPADPTTSTPPISEAAEAALKLPTIPESVRPLAWEVAEDYRQEMGGKQVRRPALLMLRPGDQSFSMELRKPSTGLENWSRWLANVEGLSKAEIDERIDKRVAEYAAAAKEAEDISFPPPRTTPTPKDLSLDDPALENFLHCEVECLFSSGEMPTIVPDPVMTKEWSAGTDPHRRASSNFKISCVVGRGKGATLTSDKFVVPEGSVWRIRFYPVMAKTAFKDRFEVDAFKKKGGADDDWQVMEQTVGGVESILFRPFEMLVEGATPELPAPMDIWSRLSPGVSGNTVSLALKRTGDPLRDLKYAAVSRVEVRHQVWAWTGLKLPPFPHHHPAEDMDNCEYDPRDGKAPPDTPFHWDAKGFHNRHDWQYAASESTLLAGKPTADENLGLIFQQAHPNDPRAIYYRFGAVVHSRYAGFFEGGVATSQQAMRLISKGGTSSARDPWRRCRLPARPVEKLPRPSLHLVVPLTRSYHFNRDEGKITSKKPDRGTGGLLVVTRGAWDAGDALAARLQLEVGVDKSWTKPKGEVDWTSHTYPAAGCDPVISTTASSKITPPINATQVFDQGPVGHTFDLGASSPHLVASSFVLNSLPDDILKHLPDGGANLAWFMARIRLRAIYQTNALASPNVPKGVEFDDTWASEWTAPEWVQFLPDANHMLPDAWRAGGVALSSDNKAWKVSGWKRPASAGDYFDHWLLVTRSIRDIRGEEQEEYLAILGKTGMAGGEEEFSIIDGKLAGVKDLHVRVLELRLSRRNLDPAEILKTFRAAVEKPSKEYAGDAVSPLDLIFSSRKKGSAVLEDAWAQIVAVSDRIDATITASTGGPAGPTRKKSRPKAKMNG